MGADGLAGFDELDAFFRSAIESLTGTYTVTIVPADNVEPDEAPNYAKLRFLSDQGRDFLAPTDHMGDNVTELLSDAVTDAFDRGNTLHGLSDLIGESILETVRERLEQSGPNGPPDVGMRPLSESWKQHKGHPRIGKYTGHLIDSIGRAEVSTRKTG